MSVKTRKAIVFDCNYNGLSIIQELGSRGIPCIAMDSGRSIGTYSRYATFHRCPDPRREEDAFIEALYDLCRREAEKPVLFPTNDQWASALARHRNRLGEVALPCVAPYETVEMLVNKEKFYRIGEERGYPTPRLWSTEALGDLGEEAFPIIAKPVSRRLSGNRPSGAPTPDLDRLRFVRIDSRADLDRFLEREKESLDHLIFQEYVHGYSDCMYTVGVYADASHTIRGLFTGHKVRGFPADSGDCVVGELAALPDALIATTARMVRELNLCGIAEFEYKKDAISGDFSLIEINPRAWSWVGITPACGASLPFIAYRDLTGECRERLSSRHHHGSVKYVKLIQDFQNCMYNYRRDHPPWASSFSSWRNDIRADRVIYAEFNAGDWPVGIVAALHAGRDIYRSIRNRRRNR